MSGLRCPRRRPDVRHAAGLGRQLVETADHPAEPVRIHARRLAIAVRCHRLSRRIVSAGVRPSAGVGDLAGGAAAGRANRLPAEWPGLWSIVETSLGSLLMRLWRLNALDGDTIQDAFSVRCDSSTMTQNDMDNGRLIAQVTFSAAATIELIHVTLALETSGASAQGIAVMAEAS